MPGQGCRCIRRNEPRGGGGILKKRKIASFAARKICLRLPARAAILRPRRQPADYPRKGRELSPDQTDRQPRHRQVATAADAIAYCARRWRQNARGLRGSSVARLSGKKGR